MRIGQDGSGTVALGRWFGGDQPFMGQVLPIAKLDAAAGKIEVRARSNPRTGWKEIKFIGSGRAERDYGWLRLTMEIVNTGYRCDAVLQKGPYESHMFQEISAAVSGLERVEKDASAAIKR